MPNFSHEVVYTECKVNNNIQPWAFFCCAKFIYQIMDYVIYMI